MTSGRKKIVYSMMKPLWYISEKSKPIEMLRNAEAGESITINIWKI
jgi:hypothetical protein